MQKKATGQNNTTFAIILSRRFSFLGFALNLNPILIPHKKSLSVTDTQSAFIDSAPTLLIFYWLFLPANSWKG